MKDYKELENNIFNEIKSRIKEDDSSVPYFDNKLKDPVWETVSLKIKKYTPFLNINVVSCQKMLKEATSQ